jgi:hypothetical protein
MSPAFKAALHRFRTMLLAVAAGGALPIGGSGHAAIEPGQQEASPADQEAWAVAQQARTVAAYQRYLELFPVGVHAEDAFRELIEQSFSGQTAKRVVDLEPPLVPGGLPQRRMITAAALSLY